jgi:hypothetical protein
MVKNKILVGILIFTMGLIQMGCGSSDTKTDHSDHTNHGN